MSGAEDVSFVPVGVVESGDVIKSGLGHLGKHPLLLSHAYLSLNVQKRGLESVEILANYPNLMYVNVSANKIADLRVLELLPTLVELNASWNNLTECLDFAPAKCTHDNAWSEGDKAMGSMLTLADLSHNNIDHLNDLGAHAFLETLLLSNNSIGCIRGLQNLIYLQVLDLSYNSIKTIEGLDGLRVQELNLEGNQLESAEGLAGLPHLSVLNISRNKIRSLYPLRTCSSLLKLEAGHNDIQVIKQTLYLRDIPWLSYLSLQGNPCCRKTHYRLRALFRLPGLKRLDLSNVTAEEYIRTCNLFGVQGGDLELRASVFSSHFPGEPFEDFGPTANFVDDEQDVDLVTGVADPGTGGGGGTDKDREVTNSFAVGMVDGIIRAASPPPSPSRPASRSAPVLREGDRVEGNYRGHSYWYPGVISCVHDDDGSFDIDYDDGESERRVSKFLVRPEPKVLRSEVPVGGDYRPVEGTKVG